ncbi:hypothetical protein LWI29_026422 [Acer saccharum]|uniref:Reverse transcriptase zinc-binding domain-containing protein n=1 Tax=Acer saccharum TaxID=4024 RepID=A0AA39SA02_ACESA|nr:hypothetical protein LWI29_026422 [Acer saccharum]
MAKWIWRFGKEENSLWKKVLCAKYGVSYNGLNWKWQVSSSPSPFIKAVGSLFEGGSALAKVLNEAKEKSGVIQRFGKWVDARWVWDIDFRRPFFDWELEQWKNFQISLDNVVIRKDIPDDIAWRFCPNGAFSVSSFRRELEERDGDQNTPAPLAHFLTWKGSCPPKVEVFMWQILRGRILIKGVLDRFGCRLSGGVDCPLCNSADETIDHLFLLCPWMWKIWNRCIRWWDVEACVNGSFQDWFLGWESLCLSPNHLRA